MLFSRNLLYTAVTRAREMVVIVGVRGTVCAMVDNNREIGRYTMLGDRIQRFIGILGVKN
jgi:exodeoxyribonuclease V alpha subunit